MAANNDPFNRIMIKKKVLILTFHRALLPLRQMFFYFKFFFFFFFFFPALLLLTKINYLLCFCLLK